MREVPGWLLQLVIILSKNIRSILLLVVIIFGLLLLSNKKYLINE